MKRKHLSWKTKCAAALASACPCCGHHHVFYDDAKLMTEDQFLSLFNWDHNILHETGHPDRDKYWNMQPMFIKAHREKTKRDAKIIAKSRRIRRKHTNSTRTLTSIIVDRTGRTVPSHGAQAAAIRPVRKLRPRGFDKRYKRKMDGTVVRRET